MPLSPDQLRQLVASGYTAEQIEAFQTRLTGGQQILPGQQALTPAYQGAQFQVLPGAIDPTLSLAPGFQQTIQEFTKMPEPLEARIPLKEPVPSPSMRPEEGFIRQYQREPETAPLAQEMPFDARKGTPGPGISPEAAVSPEAPKAPSEFQKTIGLGVVGLGLQQASRGAQAPSIHEFLGGIGNLISGGAMLAGKGGSWAIPVAVFSTLLNMAGQAQTGEIYRKRYANLNQAVTRGLLGMRSIHSGK